MFIFYLLLFAFPVLSQPSDYTVALQKRAAELHLAEDIQWLNLLHYQKSFWGGYESQVDGRLFFVSPDGKTSPQKELDATLEGFFSAEINERTKQTVRCRFPARYAWLKKVLNMDESRLPKQTCEGFEKYRDRLSPHSASLIFSSFYLGNPSSTFGHSFIRINSKKSMGTTGEHHELLDSGINYGADMNTANPLLFAVGGIAGFFTGTFVNIPYYYKVREYNDYEARDLWSYDLNLTNEELERLVAHTWELGPTYLDYFYFTENCSYHMFTILDAAAPRLKVTELLPYYVIPSDTVRRIVTVPGLVTNITYRPSTRAVFNYRLSKLNAAEKEALSDYVSDRNVQRLDGFDKYAKARILDTASDYVDFKHAGNLLKENNPEIQKWKQDILVTRAGLGIQSEELLVPTPQDEAPHLGHGIRRAGAGFGYQSSGVSYVPLKFRFSLTDILDPGPGYPKSGEIEFFTGSGRVYPDSKKFELDEALFFRIVSLSPITRYQKNISIKAEIGAQKINDPNCNACVAGVINGGPGLTFAPSGSDFFNLFVLADFQVAWSPSFIQGPWRLGGGPTAGLLFRFTPDLKMLGQSTYRYQLFSATPNVWESKATLRYGFTAGWALDISGQFYDRFSEGNLSVFYYF